MKKKISFVAVGQAAGNIGRLFEQKGYPVLYVNTSQEDLDTLEGAKFRYHIPQGEGCSKNRRRAKQLVIDDFDNIAAEIDSKAGSEMIFVIFASGGGTGSGAGPMLADLLADEGKTVGTVTVIPAPDESVKTQINSYECFSELAGIQGTGACFIIDNGRGDRLELNRIFADALDAFLEIPEKHKSVRGNIDRAEVMETLRAHGAAVVFQSGGMESADVIRAAEESALAPLEPDRAVKYIAASMAGNVQMADLETAFGTPVDNFQTFNDEGTVCCISGLSFPRTRLDVVYGRAAESRELVRKNLAAAGDAGLKDGVNFLDGMESMDKKGEAKKPRSKRDIMSRYL